VKKLLGNTNPDGIYISKSFSNVCEIFRGITLSTLASENVDFVWVASPVIVFTSVDQSSPNYVDVCRGSDCSLQ